MAPRITAQSVSISGQGVVIQHLLQDTVARIDQVPGKRLRQREPGRGLEARVVQLGGVLEQLVYCDRARSRQNVLAAFGERASGVEIDTSSVPPSAPGRARPPPPGRARPIDGRLPAG